MLAKEITSLQHPIVKHLVKLRNDRAYRYLKRTALIVGDKLIGEMSCAASFKTLVCSREKPFPKSLNADYFYIVTDPILKKISGLENPESLAAEIKMPPQENLENKERIIVLDRIGDPGNMGTLLRTALALNWDGAFITENSVDPFNEKALRAAKGATFKLPLCSGSMQKLEEMIKNHPCTVYIADIEGTPLQQVSSKMPLILILGSESRGVALELKQRFPSICIPMSPKMESLNVAVAGAILMYHLKGTHGS